VHIAGRLQSPTATDVNSTMLRAAKALAISAPSAMSLPTRLSVSQNHISSSHDVKVTLSQPTSDSTLPYFLNSRWLKPMVAPPNTRKPHARPANAKAKGPQLYLDITLA
jgi:hypothetical protein